MKTILGAMLVLGLGVGMGRAQGVFGVSLSGGSEVPPSGSSSIGSGSFALSGDNLTFSITGLLLGTTPTDAGVFGPATPSTDGPMIFDLGTPTVTPVGAQNLISYTGIEALTPTQASQLEAGDDYVNIYTSGYPGGEIRGQITLLPEPSSVSLLLVGAGMLWRSRRSQPKP